MWAAAHASPEKSCAVHKVVLQADPQRPRAFASPCGGRRITNATWCCTSAFCICNAWSRDTDTESGRRQLDYRKCDYDQRGSLAFYFRRQGHTAVIATHFFRLIFQCQSGPHTQGWNARSCPPGGGDAIIWGTRSKNVGRESNSRILFFLKFREKYLRTQKLWGGVKNFEWCCSNRCSILRIITLVCVCRRGCESNNVKMLLAQKLWGGSKDWWL